MNYFGSKLDKTNDNLNMLFNNHYIDFDLMLKRVSNIYFQEDKFQLLPFPPLLNELKKIKNLKISMIKEINNLSFPCLVGDIDKKYIWNRIEKIYFKQEIDFLLVLKEDSEKYFIYDCDISPYLVISKKRLQKNISDSKIIVEVTNFTINYSKEQAYLDNTQNFKKGNLIGSNAYFKIANIVNSREVSSKNELSLYFSIRDLSILTYKMLELSNYFSNKKLSGLLRIEMEIFNKLIDALSKRAKQPVIYQNLLALANNRIEMEKLFEK